MELSTVIKTLLPKAQLISPQTWTEIPDETQLLILQAHQEQCFLPEEALASLLDQHLINSSQYGILNQLRNQAPQLIAQARTDLLAQFPVLTQPGGGLYPVTRADACWRDLWHFLRCISYAIAGEKVQFTNPEGNQYMRQLYQVMAVPLHGMMAAIIALKYHSCELFEAEEQQLIEPYFDHLLGVLALF